MTPRQVLHAVAAQDLESGLELPTEPLAPDAWRELSDLTDAARLWGEVTHAIATGRLPATEAQAAHAVDRHTRAMATVVELEALTLDVVDLLRVHGLEVRVLKGLAVAHLDHPDPNRRTFSDVDLLVEPGRFVRTIDVLRRSGWRRDLPERRRGFDERFGKDATLRRRRWGEVDLHRTLVLGPFGLWIDLDELWSATEPVAIADAVVSALDPARRLLHACYSAVLGDQYPRLTLLRDVALLSRRSEVVDEALALSRAWRGEGVMEQALTMSTDRLGLRPSNHLRSLGSGSRLERTGLRSYRSQGGSNTALRLAGALAVPGWAGRLAYLHAHVLPDRRYRQARRAAGRTGEWRRGLSEVLTRR